MAKTNSAVVKKQISRRKTAAPTGRIVFIAQNRDGDWLCYAGKWSTELNNPGRPVKMFVTLQDMLDAVPLADLLYYRARYNEMEYNLHSLEQLTPAMIDTLKQESAEAV